MQASLAKVETNLGHREFVCSCSGAQTNAVCYGPHVCVRFTLGEIEPVLGPMRLTRLSVPSLYLYGRA